MSPKKHLKYLKKMWIDGTCYEIPLAHKDKPPESETPPETKTKNEPQFPITTDADGKLMTKFRLPRKYYTELVWSKNKWGLENLQKDTGTQITIPFNCDDGILTISGEDASQVAKARDEIHLVVGGIRDRQTFLQFISIPTLGPEITENFNKFKAAVLEMGIKSVDESVFQKPEKLHLTISVLTLLDESEIEACSSALHEYKSILDEMIAKTGPLKIQLCGLNHFQDESLKKVNVLFAEAKFDGDHSLQNLADDLFKHFYDKGFIKKPEKVKLHMTLINTKYRNTRPPPGQARQRWPKRESIDATKIMEKYKDFCFGEVKFDSVHLSLISSIGDDGFYKSLAVINF